MIILYCTKFVMNLPCDKPAVEKKWPLGQVIRAERVKFTRMVDMARCQSISLETPLGYTYNYLISAEAMLSVANMWVFMDAYCFLDLTEVHLLKDPTLSRFCMFFYCRIQRAIFETPERELSQRQRQRLLRLAEQQDLNQRHSAFWEEQDVRCGTHGGIWRLKEETYFPT